MIKIEDSFTFREKDIIVVGCSTGPDSMALLDMLVKIKNKYDLSIIVAHVNHNLRSQSAIEEVFIKDYCKEQKIVCETMVIKNYGDDNFHNEARMIRYNFFESVVHKYKANYLMTAHHGDDLVETILMRMVRGSNLSGYSGFKKIVKMKDYSIIRPLINYTKEELEEYNKLNEVKYFIDISNEKDTYTRNRYRKYILPFLKEEEPLVHLKFLKFSELLNESNNFISKECEKALKRVIFDGNLLIDKFLEEDNYIQKEILYSLLNKFYRDDLILLNDKHINLILELINSKKANGYINLPNEIIAKKEYNCFRFEKVTTIDSIYEIEFDTYIELPNNHSIKKIEDTEDNSNNICRLSSKDITLPLIVRSRKIGDKMKVKGLDGSKKVKDIFIDKKLSTSERDTWPVVVDSKGNIVWIPGIKKSVFDKKKTESYDIILKYS